MMKYVKSILATLPLGLVLAGPALAAQVEPEGTAGLSGEPVSIESLLNHYTGLIPGGPGSDVDIQTLPPAERLSAFTRSAAPMSSCYTVTGSERPLVSVSDNESSGRGFGRGGASVEAAAPAVAAITAAHFVQESPASAPGSGITPTSAGSQSAYNSNTSAATNDVILTTTIIPPPTPVPLPPGLHLLGTGLALLAPMRYRLRAKSA